MAENGSSKKKVVVVKKKSTAGKTSPEEPKLTPEELKKFAQGISREALIQGVRDYRGTQDEEDLQSPIIPTQKHEYHAPRANSSMGATIFAAPLTREEAEAIHREYQDEEAQKRYDEAERIINKNLGLQRLESPWSRAIKATNDIANFQNLSDDNEMAQQYPELRTIWEKAVKGEALPSDAKNNAIIVQRYGASGVGDAEKNLAFAKRKVEIAEDKFFEARAKFEKAEKAEAAENAKDKMSTGTATAFVAKTEADREYKDAERALKEAERARDEALNKLEAAKKSSAGDKVYDAYTGAYKDQEKAFEELQKAKAALAEEPHSERRQNAVNRAQSRYDELRRLTSTKTDLSHIKGEDGHYATLAQLRNFLKAEGLTNEEVDALFTERFPTWSNDSKEIDYSDAYEIMKKVPTIRQKKEQSRLKGIRDTNLRINRNPKVTMATYLLRSKNGQAMMAAALPVYQEVKGIKDTREARKALHKEIQNAARGAFGDGKPRNREYQNAFMHGGVGRGSLSEADMDTQIVQALDPLYGPFVEEFLRTYNNPADRKGVTPLVSFPFEKEIKSLEQMRGDYKDSHRDLLSEGEVKFEGLVPEEKPEYGFKYHPEGNFGQGEYEWVKNPVEAEKKVEEEGKGLPQEIGMKPTDHQLINGANDAAWAKKQEKIENLDKDEMDAAKKEWEEKYGAEVDALLKQMNVAPDEYALQELKDKLDRIPTPEQIMLRKRQPNIEYTPQPEKDKYEQKDSYARRIIETITNQRNIIRELEAVESELDDTDAERLSDLKASMARNIDYLRMEQLKNASRAFRDNDIASPFLRNGEDIVDNDPSALTAEQKADFEKSREFIQALNQVLGQYKSASDDLSSIPYGVTDEMNPNKEMFNPPEKPTPIKDQLDTLKKAVDDGKMTQGEADKLAPLTESEGQLAKGLQDLLEDEDMEAPPEVLAGVANFAQQYGISQDDLVDRLQTAYDESDGQIPLGTVLAEIKAEQLAKRKPKRGLRGALGMSPTKAAITSAIQGLPGQTSDTE